MTSWLSSCVFVTFTYGDSAQSFVVSIPDLCLLLYFYNAYILEVNWFIFGILIINFEATILHCWYEIGDKGQGQ